MSKVIIDFKMYYLLIFFKIITKKISIKSDKFLKYIHFNFKKNKNNIPKWENKVFK